jgi:hypothetical protein
MQLLNINLGQWLEQWELSNYLLKHHILNVIIISVFDKLLILLFTTLMSFLIDTLTINS